MKRALPLLLMLIIAGAHPAHAGQGESASFFNGKDLHARLTDWNRNPSKDIISAAVGYGFVVGVADAIHGYTEPRTGFCYRRPEKVTTNELVKAVHDYLEQNPKNRHLSAWSLTAAALAKAYPCKSP